MFIHQHIVEKLLKIGFRELESKIYAYIIMHSRIGASEIARYMDTSSQNVSMGAKRLENKRLIVKEGGKYVIGSPLYLSEIANEKKKQMEYEIDTQRSVFNSISEMINESYLNSIGKALIQTLNYEQWNELKKELYLDESDKTIRVIRSSRFKGNNTNNRTENLVKKIKEKNIKYEIITPFLDEHDISKEYRTYYGLNSKEFDNFDIDIIIKNNTLVLNYRTNNKEEYHFDTIVIKNKKISNGFKKLFEHLKKTSIKKS